MEAKSKTPFLQGSPVLETRKSSCQGNSDVHNNPDVWYLSHSQNLELRESVYPRPVVKKQKGFLPHVEAMVGVRVWMAVRLLCVVGDPSRTNHTEQQP